MSFIDTLTRPQELVRLCNEDGEFRIAARDWNGGLNIILGEEELSFTSIEGKLSTGKAKDNDGAITFSASTELWKKYLSATPERLHTELLELAASGMLNLEAEPIRLAQYYPAICRIMELLRAPQTNTSERVYETKPNGSHDTPLGRYIHLELDGYDHRIYYEEAGQGIPLILQHTAGAHGGQYRHLFEQKQITDHFRLIAYDLPFHGKSIPPVDKSWWSEEYLLKGAFLRSVPVKLAQALNLEDPVFMGCSVGGMLALDLAYHHPKVFRAVISLEGALKVEHQNIDNYALVSHPQVSNNYKARAMNGAMSPTSPESYRQEVMQTYAAGWPPAFYGDLHYYLSDYDLSNNAKSIDTSEVAVTIMSGEYDISGTVESGRSAAKQIAGSTFVHMADIGHFPMQENPVKFLYYLMPVLETILKPSIKKVNKAYD